MRAFFDLNVVLDLLFDRKPFADDAKPLLARVLAEQLEGYVAATSITTLHYIARKTAGADRAILAVERCLSAFEVVPVTGAVLEAALAMRHSDFEDDVQTAAAMAISADAIVTRDPAGFATSPIRVYAPHELRTALGG